MDTPPYLGLRFPLRRAFGSFRSNPNKAGGRIRGTSIGVLFGWFAEKIEGDSCLDGVYCPFARETHRFLPKATYGNIHLGRMPAPVQLKPEPARHRVERSIERVEFIRSWCFFHIFSPETGMVCAAWL